MLLTSAGPDRNILPYVLPFQLPLSARATAPQEIAGAVLAAERTGRGVMMPCLRVADSLARRRAEAARAQCDARQLGTRPYPVLHSMHPGSRQGRVSPLDLEDRMTKNNAVIKMRDPIRVITNEAACNAGLTAKSPHLTGPQVRGLGYVRKPLMFRKPILPLAGIVCGFGAAHPRLGLLFRVSNFSVPLNSLPVGTQALALKIECRRRRRLFCPSPTLPSKPCGGHHAGIPILSSSGPNGWESPRPRNHKSAARLFRDDN